MGIFDFIRGWVSIEIQGTFPESVLNACAARNIEFWGVRKPDRYTLRMNVRKKQAAVVMAVARHCQCQVNWTKDGGAPVAWRKLRIRYALLAGAIACLAVLTVSSAFVWEIRVEGNETLSTGEIVRALDDCGVRIGSFWPAFTGDSLRNDLLLRLPELRWAAVNYDSSTITVIVRERTEKPDMVYEDIPTHLVASKPGLVSNLSVLKGYPTVKVGQTVLAGESLVSGAVPSTFGDTRLVHALGTVEARTWYEIRADLSVQAAGKQYTGRETSRYALTFGTNRVNLYWNSSIYEGNCDKIITEYPAAVEGVFTLPVSLVKETYIEYNVTVREQSVDGLKRSMEQELYAYLESILAEDGTITTSSVSFSEKDGVLSATLHAECLENIAREVPMTDEEIQLVRLENAERGKNE